MSKAAGRISWFKLVFGLIFGCFSMYFVGAFFPWKFWDEWRLAQDGKPAQGLVRFASETNVSINEGRVWLYEFGFTGADGREYRGECYTTGRVWGRGSSVAVRYLSAVPAVAVIEGARLSKSDWSGVFVLIFPLVGFGMVASIVLSARRDQWLLRHGTIAEADVLSVDETTKKENYESVYRIVLRSPHFNQGAPLTIKRVNKDDVELALERAHDNQPVYVLYDPKRPRRLIFPEALIG